LQISLFGPLEILDGSRRLGPADLGGLKPKQLLQILLTERAAEHAPAASPGR